MPETSQAVRICLTGVLLLAFAGLASPQTGLHIAVISGEGASYTPGSRVPKPITVEVTDGTGKLVAGARVSFQVPAEGPGGLFPNGLRTDLAVTDSAGRAVLRAIQLNRTPGPFSIRITAATEQARAGTVARQTIGDLTQPAPPAAVAASRPGVQPAGSIVVPKPADVAPDQPEARSRSAPVAVSTTKKRPQPVILKEAAVTAPAPKPAAAADTNTAASSRPATVPTIVFTQKMPRSGSPTSLTNARGSHKKWIWVALLAAGGAAGGLFGSGMITTGAHAAAAAATLSPAAVTIGTPTISIGKP